MRAYHATSANNIPSILEEGLKSMWEGVYLTDSEESACRWMGFRLAAVGEPVMAVIEVEVNEYDTVEGMDHSPLMEQIFGVGKSILHPKSIKPEKIINVNYYRLNQK
jgi:hypothetical protein